MLNMLLTENEKCLCLKVGAREPGGLTKHTKHTCPFSVRKGRIREIYVTV